MSGVGAEPRARRVAAVARERWAARGGSPRSRLQAGSGPGGLPRRGLICYIRNCGEGPAKKMAEALAKDGQVLLIWLMATRRAR